ncbi:MAG: metalloregulator ArsR/SmtB family transcription factor [Burkholderiales bacterium]|nr:metalloregulator ArsR/SmtB family transcription factor [Burkholderiales bacterium]
MKHDDSVAQLSDIFSLLGEPTRLRIVLACFDAPKTVGEIAVGMSVSPSLISHHLRLLRATRIIHAERVGKNVFCSLTDEHIRSILSNMLAHIGESED